MTKKIILGLIILSTFFFGNFRVFSQEKKATPEGAVILDNKDIENFKEKIASKVAEIQKKNETEEVVAGFLSKKDSNQITIISSENNENYFIKLDDVLTKYYLISGKSIKEITFDKLEKDNYLIAVGVKEEKILNANKIYIDENFIIKTGQITEINKANYQLEVIGSEKNNYLIDIETSTKQFMINPKSYQIETIGFSKIKQGDFVSFIAKRESYDIKNNQYSAFKILIIPQEFFVK